MGKHKVHIWRESEYRSVLSHWARTSTLYCDKCGTQRSIRWLSTEEREELEQAEERRDRA